MIEKLNDLTTIDNEFFYTCLVSDLPEAHNVRNLILKNLNSDWGYQMDELIEKPFLDRAIIICPIQIYYPYGIIEFKCLEYVDDAPDYCKVPTYIRFKNTYQQAYLAVYLEENSVTKEQMIND